MIGVPIVAKTVEEAIEQIRRADEAADIIELRLDYLEKPGVEGLLGVSRKPVIVTCRSQKDRGGFVGSEADRMKILQAAVDAEADYVDVELECFGKVISKGWTKLIASWHDFEGTPTESELREIHKRLEATGADVVKLVTTATDVRDNVRLLELTRAAGTPTIAFAMGERGLPSRILTGKFGGWLTFGSLESGKESAPGQIAAKLLRSMYRYDRIGAETKLYGVIAKPVAHSMSPAIMNASFAREGLDAVYVPLLTDDAPATAREFRKLNFDGYSVTLPHKETVMEELEGIDSLARKIGAVNTIVRRQDGSLWGTNTDCRAAISSIEEALEAGGTGDESPLRGKRVAIIGARGVARAIGFGAAEAGAEITIYNRTPDKAKELAAELNCRWAPMEDMWKLEADAICNATSVGMHPREDESPVPGEVFRKGMVAFDAVYHPLMTRFLREAKQAGCVIVTGLDMFTGQAAEQFRLWTGLEAPRELMREVVLKHLATRKENQ